MPTSQPSTTPTTIRIAHTHNLLSLFKDSEGRNRGPTDELAPLVDPKGIHVVSFQMPHNDVEWRCQWLIKLTNQTAPIELWMDNGFDAFDKYTREEVITP